MNPNSPALARKPELFPYLRPYWEAFQTLSSSRQHSMGSWQAITLTEISSYCALAGIEDPVTRFRLVFCVQAMDAVFQEHQAKMAKQKAKAK